MTNERRVLNLRKFVLFWQSRADHYVVLFDYRRSAIAKIFGLAYLKRGNFFSFYLQLNETGIFYLD